MTISEKRLRLAQGAVARAVTQADVALGSVLGVKLVIADASATEPSKSAAIAWGLDRVESALTQLINLLSED